MSEADGSRSAYVDEGPPSAAPVLMLHGEPSWSYLYRKMIPVFVSAGLRAVAPDLVGFGRSDKPAKREDYTYERHVNWITRFIQKLDLRGITLVCQDLGGLIGLRVAAEHPERFARIVAANTGLPTGEGPIGDAFMAWRKFSQETPTFPVGQIVQVDVPTHLLPKLSPPTMRPFPTSASRLVRANFLFSFLSRPKIPPCRQIARPGRSSDGGRSHF